MTESVSALTAPAVCALAGCGETVAQPAGGGRRRLYCSNAHRAEARRRRLAGTVAPSTPDALGSTLDRLAGVLNDLRRHEATIRSIDPIRQAVDAARLRVDTTAEVLAAHRAAVAAAEEASRARDGLAAEQARWNERRADLESQLEDARAATGRVRETAASATDALDVAVVAHRRELDQRETSSARAAAAHEADVRRLGEELERARTAAAAAEARAEQADRRAALAAQEARLATDRMHDVEVEASRLRVEVSQAAGLAEAATARSDAADKALEEARVELRAERARHDAAVAQLVDKVAGLIAAGPRPRASTKASGSPRSVRTRSGHASAAPPSPTGPPAPDAGSRRRRSGGTST